MNILITRHDKIGDFITTLPLFFVVKRYYPEARIYALVAKVNYELAQNIDFIDEVILYDKSNFFKTLSQIKKARINTSISCFIDNKLGFLLFLSRIKKRIAPQTKIAQIFFNNTTKQKRSAVKKTEFQYNLDLAKILNSNINLDFPQPLLKLKNNQKFLKNYNLENKKIVVFHPGYGGSSDGNISLKDYINLSQSLDKYSNIQTIFTFGADDEITKTKIEKLNTSAIIYQPKTILDFCYLLNDSEILISTSTGPMHLAGALNIRTISFFGSNLFASPKRWATVSDVSKQNNFMICKGCELGKIKKIMLDILC